MKFEKKLVDKLCYVRIGENLKSYRDLHSGRVNIELERYEVILCCDVFDYSKWIALRCDVRSDWNVVEVVQLADFIRNTVPETCRLQKSNLPAVHDIHVHFILKLAVTWGFKSVVRAAWRNPEV